MDKVITSVCSGFIAYMIYRITNIERDIICNQVPCSADQQAVIYCVENDNVEVIMEARGPKRLCGGRAHARR